MATILVIDDDLGVRETVAQLLMDLGHKVLTAADGRDGVSLFRRDSVDLVITDIIMPNKEGIETIMEIRRIDPGMVIIAMSGGGRLGSVDFLQIALSLGANDIVLKPFEPSALVEAVARALAARKRPPSESADK
jgi:DNA-binding NtrC family response regulator